jgi:hypothetical protein
VVPIGAKTEGKKHEYLTNLVHCSITVHQCGFGQGEEVDDVNLLEGILWEMAVETDLYGLILSSRPSITISALANRISLPNILWWIYEVG